MSEFVCGFMFDQWSKRVVLIKKERPTWQKGLWNGVGGLIRPGEAPRDAMAREFKEETGVTTDSGEWRHFADLEHKGNCIWFFAAWKDCVPRSITDERVAWHHLSTFTLLPIVRNLTYLIPAALDLNSVFITIQDPS